MSDKDQPTCTVDACSEPTYARSMCKLHYQRVRRTGSPHVSRPCLHGTTEQRFWRHVIKGRGCWSWDGFHDKDGYGKLRVGNTNWAAHRVSIMVATGESPEGRSVLHSCDNPGCVNPDHLRFGDHVENMQDRRRAGRYYRNERHPMAKLSDADVQAIRASDGPAWKVAERFGCSASQVRNIRTGAQRSAA